MGRPFLKTLTNLIAATLMFAPLIANSAEWKAHPEFLTTKEEASAKKRFPTVESPADLQELLRDIARRFPSNKIETRLIDGIWHISGERARLITEIEIEAVTRYFRNPTYSMIKNYIGEVNAPEIRTKMHEKISKFLRERGYPEARIRVFSEPHDGGDRIIFSIDEGRPCIIDNIQIGFQIPTAANFAIAPGDICDAEKVETAARDLEDQLRDLGYNQFKVQLADMKIDYESNTATLFISGLLGQRIRYEVRDTSKTFILSEIFSDNELTDVDPSIVGPDAMTSELVRRYQNGGYIDVQVDPPKVTKVSDDEFVYLYVVRPGVRYTLADVLFEGVTIFTREELLDIMGLNSFWRSNRPLNIDNIEEGLEALRAAYQVRGFWDIKARTPGTPQRDPASGSASISVRVREGKARVFNSLSIEGSNNFERSDFEDFLPLKKGDPLDQTKLVEARRQIRTHLVSQGYIYARVTLNLDGNQAEKFIPTNVKVEITEGPKVRIGSTTIVGLARTKEKVVQRELLFATGDWYIPEIITESRRALTRLGLFSSVQIVPANRKDLTDKSPVVDLVIEVREGYAGNVSFGPGWKLLSGWNYTTEASYSNLGGVGRRVSIRGAISEEAHQEAIGDTGSPIGKTLLGRSVGAGYVEPYIWNLPVDAEISISHRAQAKASTWQLTYGGEIAFAHKLRIWAPGSRIALFYGQKISRTEGQSQTESNTLVSDVRIGEMGLRYSMDRRDSVQFPTSGFTFDAEAAWARFPLGGDLAYDRYDIENNWFFGITSNWVFAVGMNVTTYRQVERSGASSDVLPFSERLLLGGTDTIRGYRPLTLGPLVRAPIIDVNDNNQTSWDAGCPYGTEELGGSNLTLLRTEIRHKLSENYAAAVFLDSGTVFLSDEQMQLFQQSYEENTLSINDKQCSIAPTRSAEANVGYSYNELLKNPGYFWSRHYLSYGTAFSILTPIGSINLAYGIPLKEPETSACDSNEQLCFSRIDPEKHWLRRGQFHLSVGARF